VPLAEDWLMVAPLTGHEPSLARWLWAQNNEHRVPLPKLVYLGVLELAGGDFRAGMVVNALVVAAVAAAMVRTARRLRGGRTSYADAFFPAALLHLGHWENLVWGWQLQFVLSTALVCTLLLVVVRDARLPGARPAAAAVALVLLPLSGANGLIFALAMTPWAVVAGVRAARPPRDGAAGDPAGPPGSSAAGRTLVGAAATSVVLVGVYFIGWYSPPWNPPNPGRRASLETAVKFAAVGFGPVASHWWTLAAVGVAAALLPAAVLVARAAWRAWPGARGGSASGGPWADERERALGLLCFAGGTAVLTLAMGWGRAAYVPTAGIPDRYALFAAPALCAAYFVWQLYGPPIASRAAQAGLLVVALAVLPGNVREGLSWRDWYVGGAAAVERDVAAGVPRLEIARRHRQFLLHWNEGMLAERIAMLRDAGIGPFARVRERQGVTRRGPGQY
jgi:hypothetical protein